MCHARSSFCSLVPLASCLLLGCGSNHGPERVAVHGQVLLDNEPLAKGSIVFVPSGDQKGPESAGTIENGSYEIPQSAGPLIGTMAVRIWSEQDLGFPIDDPQALVANAKPGWVPPANLVPRIYNDSSNLTVRTTRDDENVFDFNLSSKPAKKR